MRIYLSNMKNKFKINLWVMNTWMCNNSRVGELGSEYQGRSRVSSFPQETGIKIQYRSRIGLIPNLLENVQDAQWFLTHLPSFFYTSKRRDYV